MPVWVLKVRVVLKPKHISEEVYFRVGDGLPERYCDSSSRPIATPFLPLASNGSHRASTSTLVLFPGTTDTFLATA